METFRKVIFVVLHLLGLRQTCASALERGEENFKGGFFFSCKDLF